jgi:hypothetical protein
MDKGAEIVKKVLMVEIQLVQKFHGFDNNSPVGRYVRARRKDFSQL